MMGGKKHGPRRKAGAGRQAVERRVRPPDVTGREAEFFRKRVASSCDVLIHLANGETVRGTIERFDREMITVACERGPEVVLPKREIRYIEEV